MASPLAGGLANTNAHPFSACRTPHAGKLWCGALCLNTLAYSDSIHQQYKHTFRPVWPPAVSPHPYHCSFTDNTAILDALKKHVSHKRAHRHLIFSSFTDIIHTLSYTIEFGESHQNLDSAGLWGIPTKTSLFRLKNVMQQSRSFISWLSSQN